MTQPTAVSLFAGVGGFDLALERNGVKVVAAAEIDKHASAVLAKRFPRTKLFSDVREVTGDDLRAAGFVPERGIITGGFPCQDLSVAGKRAGFTGKRSSLFYEIARIADETKAEWLVLENVPGLLTSQRGADMGAVVGTLADLGYVGCWRVLDAQHFGVPQRRRRVFIVARRAGNPTSCAEILFERESVFGDFTTSGTTRQDAATGFGTSTTEAGFTDGSASRAVEPTEGEPDHYSFDSWFGSQAAVLEDIAPPLKASQGAPAIHPAERGPVGPLTATGMSRARGTETVESEHYIIDDGGTVYEPSRRDGIRTYGRTAPTLQSFMGTGGGNVPLAITAFTQNQREEVRDLHGIATALQAEPGTHQQTYIAQGVTEGGSGVHLGDNMASLQVTGGKPGQGRPTVLVQESVAISYDGYNQNIEVEVHRPLRIGRDSSDFVAMISPTADANFVAPTLTAYNMDSRSPQSDESQRIVSAVHQAIGYVRRLTPLECERLQGFPDGWTEGQADSHRYKQMGNAVAVPVVEWVIAGLVEQMER